MIIYGIKTCGSVRKALKFCKENNLVCNFHDIRKEPLSEEKIRYFASKVNVNLLFNNKGSKYRDLKLKELNLNDSEKFEWLCKENMLLKRPIIEYSKDKVLCAFDEEVYKEILK